MLPIGTKTNPIQPPDLVVTVMGTAAPPTQHRFWHQTTRPGTHKVDSIPIGAASAANASGLVQTPQSKVPRHKPHLHTGLLRRGTSDWVIAFLATNSCKLL